MSNEQDPSSICKAASDSIPVVGTRADCHLIWTQLVTRQLEVIEAFATIERSQIILGSVSVASAPVPTRRVQLLERVLLGATRKVIAAEGGFSTSWLAGALKDALASVGLKCSPSRVPRALVVLAHAAHGLAHVTPVLIAHFEHQGRPRIIISHQHHAPALEGLTPTERQVMELRLQGQSYADIARLRNTSYQTIANQISRASQRLGASGRMDVLHLVHSSTHHTAPIRRNRSRRQRAAARNPQQHVARLVANGDARRNEQTFTRSAEPGHEDSPGFRARAKPSGAPSFSE